MRVQEVLLSLNQTLNNIGSEKKSHNHTYLGSQNGPKITHQNHAFPQNHRIFPVFSPYFHGENEVIFTIAIGDAPATRPRDQADPSDIQGPLGNGAAGDQTWQNLEQAV
jgi:hypothetical protein